MGKGADVGVGKKTSRKRAVGTREHITAYLAETRELFDANGMASTQLAAAIGYPGSSVAFAQLLSGMERSGLIEREVRGKRTYRISLGVTPPAGLLTRKVLLGRPVGRRGWLGLAGRRGWLGLGGRRGWLGSVGLMGLTGPGRRLLTTTSWRAACWYRWSGGWPSPRRAPSRRTPWSCRRRSLGWSMN